MKNLIIAKYGPEDKKDRFSAIKGNIENKKSKIIEYKNLKKESKKEKTKSKTNKETKKE